MTAPPVPLSDVGRTRGDAEALWACAEVATMFCELLDAGEVAAAFELHHPDLAFYPPGAPVPLDRAAAQAAGEQMVGAYSGRRTLHLLGNFAGRVVAEDLVEAQYVVSVYELTHVVDGVAVERDAPTLFAFAHERALFRRGADGAWRYAEQRMLPIAPRNPFGGKTHE